MDERLSDCVAFENTAIFRVSNREIFTQSPKIFAPSISRLADNSRVASFPLMKLVSK